VNKFLVLTVRTRVKSVKNRSNLIRVGLAQEYLLGLDIDRLDLWSLGKSGSLRNIPL